MLIIVVIVFLFLVVVAAAIGHSMKKQKISNAEDIDKKQSEDFVKRIESPEKEITRKSVCESKVWQVEKPFESTVSVKTEKKFFGE